MAKYCKLLDGVSRVICFLFPTGSKVVGVEVFRIPNAAERYFGAYLNFIALSRRIEFGKEIIVLYKFRRCSIILEMFLPCRAVVFFGCELIYFPL